MSEAAKEMLGKLRVKKEELLRRFHSEFKMIEAAEHFLAEECGEEAGGNIDLELDFYRSRLELGNASHTEAAQWALKRLGSPSKMGDIIGLLLRFGFRKPSEKKELTNSLFQAMKRKDLFTKLPNAMWGLADWEKSKN